MIDKFKVKFKNAANELSLNALVNSFLYRVNLSEQYGAFKTSAVKRIFKLHREKDVRLTLTDSSGQIRTTTTTPFEYYRFDDVQARETYILSASGKRYIFSQPVQVLNVNEETSEVNFIADSEKRLRIL